MEDMEEMEEIPPFHLPVLINWRYVSRNPNITIKHIKENPQYPWSYNEYSFNTNINLDVVNENQDIEYNYKRLLSNESFTPTVLKQILEDPTILKINDPSFDITDNIEFIKNQIKKKLHFKKTMDDIIMTKEQYKKEWNEIYNYDILSKTRFINVVDVLKYPEYEWTLFDKNDSPNLTIEYINEHPELDFTDNNVLIEYIYRTQDLKWNWQCLTNKTDLKTIIKYKSLPWDWQLLEKSKNILWEDVKRLYDKFPNWDFVYSLSDVTWDMVVEVHNNEAINTNVIRIIEY